MTIVLDAVDFWRVRALGSETQRLALEARAAAAAVQLAQHTQNACVAAVAAKYGFDPAVATFRLDDATLTLTVDDSAAAASTGTAEAQP